MPEPNVDSSAEALLNEWKAVAPIREADKQYNCLLVRARARAARDAHQTIDVQTLRDVQAELADRAKPAFEAVREATKQIMTLTTAILGLMITFWEKTRGTGTTTDGGAYFVVAGWLAYSISIAMGVATLQLLAGNLERPQNPLQGPSIYATSIATVYTAHLYSFAVGTVLLVIFGIVRVM